MDELDEFLMQDGNESFYGSPKDYKEDTIKNLNDLWKKACQVYFNNDEGKAIYSKTQQIRIPNKINIPFVIDGLYGKKILERY